MKKDWIKGHHIAKEDKGYAMGHWEKGHYVTTGKRGFWSKYGGGEKWKEPAETKWHCQSCGEERYAFMPSYKIPLDNTEFARICSLCKHLAVIREILVFHELLSLMKPFGKHSNAIANLLTIPLPWGYGQ